MIRLLQTIIFLLPLLLTAETITIKTKAPQNRNAVFQYRVPKGYDKNRREMYRVLMVFGGRKNLAAFFAFTRSCRDGCGKVRVSGKKKIQGGNAAV